MGKKSLKEKIDGLKARGEEALKDLKETGAQLKEEGERLIQKGKETAYQTAAKVEQKAGEIKEQVENREGTLGSIADKVEKVAQTVAPMVDQAITAIKEKDADIKARGGYKAVATELMDKGIAAFADSAISAQKTIEEKLLTNGEYDPAKARALLKEGTRTAAVLGKKGYETLAELTKKGVATVKQDYRELVPTREELMTRYAGIGTDYKKVLFRPNYEACLEFHTQAAKIMPPTSKRVQDILVDIKASASGSLVDLVEYYRAQNNEVSFRKSETAQKYFTKAGA